MLTKRIIACLDVDAGRVVKGTQFLELRDAGDPAELAAALKGLPAGYRLGYGADGTPKLVRTRKRKGK